MSYLSLFTHSIDKSTISFGYWLELKSYASVVDSCILAGHSGLCDGVSTTSRAAGSIPEGLRDRQVELAYLGIVMPFGGCMLGLAVSPLLSINKR